MSSRRIVPVLVLAAMLAVGDEAAAQLFGARSVGSPLSRPARPALGRLGAGSRLGEVPGRERFVRGSRQAANFVGTDSLDRRGFVGSQQAAAAAGPVQSATSGLRIESGPDANQGQTKTAAPRTGMYDPRLRIGFRFTNESPQALSTALTRRLLACDGIRRSSPIVVSVEGETATLRGAVLGDRDRSLARLMLLLEPGISQVRNELTVTGLPRTAMARPAAEPADRADRVERAGRVERADWAEPIRLGSASSAARSSGPREF